MYIELGQAANTINYASSEDSVQPVAWAFTVCMNNLWYLTSKSYEEMIIIADLSFYISMLFQRMCCGQVKMMLNYLVNSCVN